MFKKILCKILGHKKPKGPWRYGTSKKCLRCGTRIWSRIS